MSDIWPCHHAMRHVRHAEILVYGEARKTFSLLVRHAKVSALQSRSEVCEIFGLAITQ